MRPVRPFRSTVAVCLLAILAALGTGLPSHHHGEALNGDRETRVVSADHHAHATRLVEQDDRVPSGNVQIAPPASVTLDPMAAPTMRTEIRSGQRPRPQDRAPPPGAPRAPPVRI